MYAKHSAVDDGAEAHEIKHFATVPPHACGSILLHALVVKAVHLRDLPRLVVASDQRHAVGVPDLERQQEEERLDRVEPSVDVVACFRRRRVGEQKGGEFPLGRRKRGETLFLPRKR